jgi:hypothetical protein
MAIDPTSEQLWIQEMVYIIEFYKANNDVPHMSFVTLPKIARLLRVEKAYAREMPSIEKFSPDGLKELKKLSLEIIPLMCVNKSSIKQYALAMALFGQTITECFPAAVIEFLENIESSRIESKRIMFIEENLYSENIIVPFSWN